MARDRKGEFEPRVLPHYQRREEKIDQRIIDLIIGGISIRKMKKITKELLQKDVVDSFIDAMR
ncbi:MAG: transposase [Bacillota bacterium]